MLQYLILIVEYINKLQEQIEDTKKIAQHSIQIQNQQTVRVEPQYHYQSAKKTLEIACYVLLFSLLLLTTKAR